jgi:hypothetical protein
MNVVALVAVLVSVCVVSAASVLKGHRAYRAGRPTLLLLALADVGVMTVAFAMPTHPRRAMVLALAYVLFTAAYSWAAALKKSCNCFGVARPTTLVGLLFRAATAILLLASATADPGNGISRSFLLVGVAVGGAVAITVLGGTVRRGRAATFAGSAIDSRGIPRRAFLARSGALIALASAGVLSWPIPAYAETACYHKLEGCTNCCTVGCYGNWCYSKCSNCYSYCVNFGWPQCTDFGCWANA